MSHGGLRLLDGAQEYEVYARREPSDELRHVGTVSAPGPDLARVYAHMLYDEEHWSEMVVTPRQAELRVQARGGGTAAWEG